MKQLGMATVLVCAVSLIVAGVSAGTVTDIDGNVYQTVQIGTQVWMAENLKVTHYSNGDPIPYVVPDSVNWTGVTSGLCCAPNGDSVNVATYGYYYNWYAGADPRNLAPEGWHVATDGDYKTMELFLGMSPDVVNNTGYRGGYPIGAMLKETGTTHWTSCSNTTATNVTGFTALPGGVMDNRPIFNEFGSSAFFWTATEHELAPTAAWARHATCNLVGFGRDGFGKDYGGTVRCVRNELMGVGDDGDELPHGFDLVQNYPNPFNPSTAIEYSLPVRSQVTIEVFNIAGQRVRTLVAGEQSAGSHRVEWNGTDEAGRAVSTGVYLYRFAAGDYEATRKMVLVK